MDPAATATFKGASIGYGTAVGTAGQYFSITDITQVTTEIMKMVTQEVLNIKEMSLSVPDQYKSWFSTSPGNYLNVGPSTSNSFNVKINVPADTAAGEYSFPINVIADGSVLDTANVKINVIPGTTSGSGVLELASADYGVIENGGNANITINRLNGSTGEVSVNYSTSDGMAKAAQDYTETKGTVVFNDGEISKTISIPILDDTIKESAENFYFNISEPTGGATLGSIISSNITIADDEIQKSGIVEFGSFDYDVSSTSGKAEITVDRTNGSDGAVTVDYATSNGTATEGVEYTSTSGTLTFNSGETTKTFYVPINKAAISSGSKNFNITLSNPTSGAMLGAKSTTVVNIQYVPTVSSISINPTDITLEQGKQQQLTVTSVMSDSSTKDVTNSSTGTTYASSNTAVATVDANGLITVLPTATVGYKSLITAKNNGIISSCTVTVGSTEAPKPNSLSVTPTTVTLRQGETQQLTVTGTMPDGSAKDVTNSSTGTTYTSSNTAVATVDANGLITVLPTGTIGYKTVISAKNNGKTSSCTVTVGSGAVTVNSISLDTTAATIVQGATKQLLVTGTMSDGSTKDVTNSSTGTTYTSSNTAVATVDANGLITVLPTGTIGYKTVISAKNNGKTSSCTVTVGSGAVTVNSISLDTTAATIVQGATKQLLVTGTMSDGSTKDVTNSSTGTTYTSSNTAVATVDANGLITVLPTGTIGYKTVISAKSNGKTSSCTVTVGSGAVTVNSISLDTTAATIVQGATKQLLVTGTMSDGSAKDVTNSSTGTTYTSSNTAVATVDANGLITVLPTGTIGYKTVISAKNNGKTSSCTVTVGSGAVTVNSISLDTTAATIVQGATKQLLVTGTMSDGSAKDVTNSSTGTTYTSSNTAVATVDANGLITVLPTGTIGYKTVISAKNNGKTSSCTVTVGSGAVTVNSISLDTTAATITQGATKQLVVTGTMSDGSTKDVTNSSTGTTYTSSNTAVATVDANGLITVLPTATIGYKTVITAKNGTKTVSCTVTVGVSGATVTSISANLSTATLAKGATHQLIVTGTMSDSSTKDVTASSTGTTYTSSNTAVATVDANGLITVLPTATSGYKCNITIKNNGKIFTCTVTVAP